MLYTKRNIDKKNNTYKEEEKGDKGTTHGSQKQYLKVMAIYSLEENREGIRVINHLGLPESFQILVLEVLYHRNP